MQDDAAYRHATERFGRLASVYDRRWRRYTEATLTVALDALTLSGVEQVLDVGCGTGECERLALSRFPQLAITGVDVTAAMVERARHKFADSPQAQFQVAQAESLPFPAARFDAAVCANMFHRVREPVRVLQELRRVLRPGGQLVMVDWCRDFWHCRLLHYWWRLTDPSYVRMYRLEELRELISRAGLAVGPTHRFTAPYGYGMMLVRARASAARSGGSGV